MKKQVIISAMLLIATVSLTAQKLNNAPNSNWPYLFNDFSECIIAHKDSNISKVNANYNLLSEELQFMDKDQIKTLSNPDDILHVRFQSYTLIPDDKRFLIVIGDANSDFKILKKEKGNFNDIMESKGAYGSSTTTASVKQQTDLNIGGVNNMNMQQLTLDRDKGKTFRVNEQYYFKQANDSELTPLKKKNILKAFSKNKGEISAYLKSEKISLKDDTDLKRFSKFINTMVKD
ncbi:hypothetical protein [Saccharicrinis sp. FJH54]|uniref:hypothetical protein n=1 Tax=Saccharicrinis sp. FJH54 TaxID=3344665 RepID=UPI0035D476A4